jgi:methylated-DNA-[protein]-cysteine S-methyltransferase
MLGRMMMSTTITRPRTSMTRTTIRATDHHRHRRPLRTHGERFCVAASPIGDLLLLRTERGLSGLYLLGLANSPAIEPGWVEDDEAFAEVRAQLDEYFAGTRASFEVALDLEGTAFQRSVWEALLAIPFGKTESYGELAERIGRPGAFRAVGLANGRNPVSIIVPCHRVIGADGSLTGYGWGTERKRWLLDLEAVREPTGSK